MKKSGPLFFKPARKPAAPRGDAKLRNAALQDVTLQIDRLSAEGRGMAFVDGKPVFVANCLPGETVRAHIYEHKREYAVASLLEVIVAAPARIAPRCAAFGECGGCQLQMLDYTAQLEHKQRTLAHLLAPFSPRQWDEPLVAEQWHYRHRVRLGVCADQHGRPCVGFKSAASHRVVPVRHCDIADRRLLPLLETIPEWLAQLRKWQHIDDIVLAVDSAGQLALAYAAAAAFPPADRALLLELTRAAGVGLADASLQYAIPSQGVTLEFRARDFTQVNPKVNDALVARSMQWLDLRADDEVADFFCGLGNFALPMARRAARVVGYEAEAEMVARATRNLAAAGIRNVEFAAADLFAATPALPATLRKALLDPPRAGARSLCRQLATSSLQTVLYVSCNPHTLVRDLHVLVDGGFTVQRAALVDLFPQTGHIEAMVLCERGR